MFAPLGNGGEKLSGSQRSASLQGGRVSNDGRQKCIADRFLTRWCQPPKVTASKHYGGSGCFLFFLLDNKSWKLCSLPSDLNFLLQIPAGGYIDNVLGDPVSGRFLQLCSFVLALIFSSFGSIGKRVSSSLFVITLWPSTCLVLLLVLA